MSVTASNLETNPLPREITPGLFWLGDCLHFPQEYHGHELHGYHSVYVLVGATPP